MQWDAISNGLLLDSTRFLQLGWRAAITRAATTHLFTPPLGTMAAASASASSSDEPSSKHRRSYEDELKYISQVSDHEYHIRKGFVPGMNVSVVDGKARYFPV